STPAVLPGAVGVFVKDRSLIRRIHMIAHYRKPTAIETLLGGMLFLLLAVFGLTSAATTAENRTDGEQAAPARVDPARVKDRKSSVIAGMCQDEKGQPLSGIQVMLYREDHRERKQERL